MTDVETTSLADAPGTAIAPTEPEIALLPGEVKPHPTPFAYVIVALVLFVITSLEVGASYLAGDVPDIALIVLLLAMAFVKFFLVAAWFMHLRTDKPVFRRVFILGGVGAIILYTIVVTSLHIFSPGK